MIKHSPLHKTLNFKQLKAFQVGKNTSIIQQQSVQYPCFPRYYLTRIQHNLLPKAWRLFHITIFRPKREE